MTGSGILPCIDNSNNLGTKAAIPRVDTGPYGVETPTPLLAHCQLAGLHGARATRGRYRLTTGSGIIPHVCILNTPR